jgi:hypothetical protein
VHEKQKEENEHVTKSYRKCRKKVDFIQAFNYESCMGSSTRQTECILRRGFETDWMQSQNVNTGSKELPEWKVGWGVGYIISTT